MTKAEAILKTLGLDYETVEKNVAWSITPMNFMTDMKIILVIKDEKQFEMFLWDGQSAAEITEFQIEENIGSIYSFLYEYKLKSCDTKTKTIRR